jgi:hypothetical protein
VSPEIQRTIERHYPKRALTDPADDPSVKWSWDVDNSILRAIVAELSALDPVTRPGTRGRHSISEELLVGRLHVQLSHLGPFAALNHRAGSALDVEIDPQILARAEEIRRVLGVHGVMLLELEALDAPSEWIAGATVWDCLFEGPK